MVHVVEFSNLNILPLNILHVGILHVLIGLDQEWLVSSYSSCCKTQSEAAFVSVSLVEDVDSTIAEWSNNLSWHSAEWQYEGIPLISYELTEWIATLFLVSSTYHVNGYCAALVVVQCLSQVSHVEIDVIELLDEYLAVGELENVVLLSCISKFKNESILMPSGFCHSFYYCERLEYICYLVVDCFAVSGVVL